ncbi:MAG: hypothetical protein JWP31_2427 [Aeromicrobium sp.]|nr:hypothetical protein [Aeromicrobium sp.]
MRKILALLAGAAVVMGLLAPAEAATKTYSITLTPTPAGKTDPARSYNDTALDVSPGIDDGRQRTRIRGRVTGGPVRGRSVSVTATNLSRDDHRRFYLGAAKLSDHGYFTMLFNPRTNNAGVYRIEIAKRSGSGYAGRVKSFTIRVFQFVDAGYFYDAAASNPVTDPVSDPPRVGDADGEPFAGTGKDQQAYYVNAGGRLVFRTAGQNCMQMNFNVGVSNRSTRGGSFWVKVGSTTVVPTTVMSRNQAEYEPSRDTQKRLTPTGGDLAFHVAPYDDGNAATNRDYEKVRFVVGHVVASCTFPVINPPVVNSAG